MNLKKVFQLSSGRIILASLLISAFMLMGDPISHHFWTPDGISIGDILLIIILNVLFAYFVASIFVFNLGELFKHIKNLKKYSDVFKFKNVKIPLIISIIIEAILVVILILTNEGIFEIVNESVVNFLLISIPTLAAIIYYWKKDLFVERFTWFAFLYGFITMFVPLVINMIMFANDKYFLENVITSIFHFLTLAISVSLGGFILGGLIDIIKEPKAIIRKKSLIINILIIIIVFLWVVSKISFY